MRAAAQSLASVTLSAKSRKSWAEWRSVLMWNSASKLSAYSQTSLCTRASAQNPINITKTPLKNSKVAIACSACRWRRWRRSGLEASWRMNADDDLKAEYHGRERSHIRDFPALCVVVTGLRIYRWMLRGRARPRDTRQVAGAMLGRWLHCFFADGGAQLSHDFLRRLDRGGVLVHVERDRSHAGMAAATVALANASQVHFRFLRSPGIRSHRNLHAEAALAEPHAVDRLRMQVVGNEFVVALEIVIGDVEENRAVLALSSFLENPDGKLVAFE